MYIWESLPLLKWLLFLLWKTGIKVTLIFMTFNTFLFLTFFGQLKTSISFVIIINAVTGKCQLSATEERIQNQTPISTSDYYKCCNHIMLLFASWWWWSFLLRGRLNYSTFFQRINFMMLFVPVLLPLALPGMPTTFSSKIWALHCLLCWD